MLGNIGRFHRDVRMVVGLLWRKGDKQTAAHIAGFIGMRH
jgi:hypothetical protein